MLIPLKVLQRWVLGDWKCNYTFGHYFQNITIYNTQIGQTMVGLPESGSKKYG